jgi:hypothetical protein
MKLTRMTAAILGILIALGVLAAGAGAPTASSQALTLRAVRAPEQPSLDPDWDLWAKLPSVDVPITAQNITYPMGGGSIASVTLQAMYYDETLYVRAQWQDGTRDAVAASMNQFSDAVALEFPGKSAVTVPSFCMGQANANVNIWQWRADSQEGGPLAVLRAARPNSFTDGLPPQIAKDPVFQPARALKNPATMLGDTPVQNLVAQAFGTLAPATEQTVQGNGVWRDGRWAVVFARPFAGGDPTQASFSAGRPTNMAVAVWNGSHGDRAGQKTVSQFVTLDVSNAAFKHGQSSDMNAVWFGLVLGGGAVLVGLALISFVALASFGGRRT